MHEWQLTVCLLSLQAYATRTTRKQHTPPTNQRNIYRPQCQILSSWTVIDWKTDQASEAVDERELGSQEKCGDTIPDADLFWIGFNSNVEPIAEACKKVTYRSSLQEGYLPTSYQQQSLEEG